MGNVSFDKVCLAKLKFVLIGRKQVVLRQLASENGVFLVRQRVTEHTKRAKLTQLTC